MYETIGISPTVKLQGSESKEIRRRRHEAARLMQRERIATICERTVEEWTSSRRKSSSGLSAS